MTIPRRQLLALLPVALYGQPTSDEQIWQEFIAWCRQVKLQGSLREEYLGHLAKTLPPEELKRRDAILDRMVRERDDLTALAFDRVYASPDAKFRTEPNAFLVECSRDLQRGAALDVAMGQGRNAIWLAQQGWRVTGFDISTEGLAVARTLAGKAGVKIDAVHSGHQQFDFGLARWDLIVFSYAFVPITEPAFVQRVTASLRPAGAIVYEHFLKEGGRGPKGSTPAGELRAAFGAMEIVRYEEAVGRPDWAQHESRLARMFARKR